MTNRRNFLGGIIAAAAAPAIVRAEIIMPVRSVWKPTSVGYSSFDVAGAPDHSSLFTGQPGRYNDIKIVASTEAAALEAAALQQLRRFYGRMYAQSFERALVGSVEIVKPVRGADWVRALKGLP